MARSSFTQRAKWRILNWFPYRWWGPVVKVYLGDQSKARSFRINSRRRYNTYIDPTVQIIGYTNVRIGSNTSISEDVFLNVNIHGNKLDELRIGDNCFVGRRCFFSTGLLIILKDYSFVGMDCHLLGCGHNYASPFQPKIASGLTEGAPIEIGVNCWLATSVTVLQGVCIGMGSVIGAQSFVTKDIPPFSVAIGRPCEVVKRFDFGSCRWIPAADWTAAHEALIPTEAAYLKGLRQNYSSLPLPLHASSSRFGWMA